MLQNIIVFGIVFIALFFVGRRLYRVFSSQRAECGCVADEACAACAVPDEVKENCSGKGQNPTCH